MGLAASQARLLTITARLADNELRSQTINNAKMRLATQSSQASDEYITALNDAQMMFSNVGVDGIAKNQALTFNALTSFSQYNNQYGIKNSAGMFLVSEKDAANFKNHSNDLDGFLGEYGLKWDTTFFDEETSGNLSQKLVDFYGNPNDTNNEYGKISEFFEGLSNEDLKTMYLTSLSQNSSIERLNYEGYANAYFTEWNNKSVENIKKLENIRSNPPVCGYDGNEFYVIYNNKKCFWHNMDAERDPNDPTYDIYNYNFTGHIKNMLYGYDEYGNEADWAKVYEFSLANLILNKGIIDGSVKGELQGFFEPIDKYNLDNTMYGALPAVYNFKTETKSASYFSGDDAKPRNSSNARCIDDLVYDGSMHFNLDEYYNISGVKTVSEIETCTNKTTDGNKTTYTFEDGSQIIETKDGNKTTYKKPNDESPIITIEDTAPVTDPNNTSPRTRTVTVTDGTKTYTTVFSGDENTETKTVYENGNKISELQLKNKKSASFDNYENTQFYIEETSDGVTQKYTYWYDKNSNDKIARKMDLYELELIDANNNSDPNDDYYRYPEKAKTYFNKLIDVYFNAILADLKCLKAPMSEKVKANFEQYSNEDDLINLMINNIKYLGDLNALLKDEGREALTYGSSKFDSVVNSYIVDYMLNVFGEPKFAWVDENDTTNSGNADAKAQWYTNLFERMQKGYKVLENGLANSREWMEYAFESGLVTMEQVDKSYNWISLDYKSCANIFEDSDNSGIVAKAEAKYNRAMNDIKQKDNMYDLQLKNIDTEHSALQTEYESIKNVMKKNIERTMKFDQSG